MTLAILIVSFSVGLTFVFDAVFPPNLTRLHDQSIIVSDDAGAPLHMVRSRQQDLWRLPVKLQDVDPRYIQFLIAIEDQRFWHHWGIDPVALIRATYQFVRYRRVISGGSTLTMQTVRLLEPRPRTIFSKVTELWRAVQLEWHFSKPEILSMYLTLAPYGGNLEGIRAATLAYFHHEPAYLDIHEAALLVTLPKSPSRLRPDTRPWKSKSARNQTLKNLATKELVTAADYKIARAAPIPAKRYGFPRGIPHLARRLIQSHPNQNRHHTSIDPNLQASIEQIAKAALRAVTTSNIAILVVDHHEHKVKAYVGSQNFWSQRNCGQVDFITAIRSPGSTLKPFIYALGFDLGLIYPDTILRDARTRFGGYAPTNFDKQYHGDITVKEALQLSLNVPAVNVLSQVGPLRFCAMLQQSGTKMLLPNASNANLAIGLGGVGMTLEDLVLLYSALGNGGQVKPLTYSNTLSIGQDYPLMSRSSAHNIVSILIEEPSYSPASAKNQHTIAIKTGTSYGYRDAWAIGLDGRYTVGVWLGCPDGTSMRGATGQTFAVPVLKKIFNTLPSHNLKPIMTHLAESTATPFKLKPGLRPQSNQQDGNNLSLLFPVNESVIHAKANAPLPLLVEGGNGSLTWLVNGLPVGSANTRRKNFWHPPEPGFYTITAVDESGNRASAEIEIRAMHAK